MLLEESFVFSSSSVRMFEDDVFPPDVETAENGVVLRFSKTVVWDFNFEFLSLSCVLLLLLLSLLVVDDDDTTEEEDAPK